MSRCPQTQHQGSGLIYVSATAISIARIPLLRGASPSSLDPTCQSLTRFSPLYLTAPNCTLLILIASLTRPLHLAGNDQRSGAR